MRHPRHSWIWLAPLILCECGGHSPTPGLKITRPSRAVWCPTRLILPTGLSKPNRPAAGSFDTRTLLGQTETKASADARQHGCSWRVVERDGHGLTITADAQPNRVDAAINHGIVTAVGVF